MTGQVSLDIHPELSFCEGGIVIFFLGQLQNSLFEIIWKECE